MSKAPILVLQMQRMGDLILTFPLLGWLKNAYQGHPIWVIGEERFFTPLMSLSPVATYFSYSDLPDLSTQHFHLVINISHRPEAAAIAGKVHCDMLYGPYMTKDGVMHIHGNWQLYRASITQNNYYNLYHWTDMHALDCIPEMTFRRTDWPLPRQITSSMQGRIGLFVGASEIDKQPDIDFWVTLAKQLLKRGYKPVLLGGAAERETGYRIAQQIGGHALNMCGNFSVFELAHFIAELDLLVTPDTGPMHLAVWIGTPTINLSMGPVNVWETGPFSPKHYVIRSRIACVGCWECSYDYPQCKKTIEPWHVMALIQSLYGQPAASQVKRAQEQIDILITERNTYGLYNVRSMSCESTHNHFEHQHAPSERTELALFWYAWFGHLFGTLPHHTVSTAWKSYASIHPNAALSLHAQIRQLIRQMAQGNPAEHMNAATWKEYNARLHPLTGFLHMQLSNEQNPEQQKRHLLKIADTFLALCTV